MPAFVFLLALIACAWAADEPVPIIAQQSQINADGSYDFKYETGDGTKSSEHGELKKVEETNVEVAQGEYSYKTPEGEEIKVQYTADEKGFQPVGDHIPKVPEPIARALKWIAEHPAPPEDNKRVRREVLKHLRAIISK